MIFWGKYHSMGRHMYDLRKDLRKTFLVLVGLSPVFIVSGMLLLKCA